MEMDKFFKLVIQSENLLKLIKKVPIIAQMWYYYIVNAKHRKFDYNNTVPPSINIKPI